MQQGGHYLSRLIKTLFGKNNRSAKDQAIRITLIYLLAGCLWVILSDKLVEALPLDRSAITLISIAKGWFYVLASAALIFCLIYPALKKIIRTQGKYEEKQLLLKSMINSIPDLIYYKDREGRYIGCNTAVENFLGRTESEINGKTDFDLFDREIAAQFIQSDLEMMATRTPQRNEDTLIGADNRKIYLETIKSLYYNHQGEVIGLIGISRDITDRKLREKEIQYLNYNDVLTGLYNRTFFQEELQRLDTHRQLPLSIITGDINGLKLINDALGHAEGDKILVDTANILRNCCRTDDIIARTGGDEFCILLPKTDCWQAQKVVDRIRAGCEAYAIESNRESYYTSIALGYATKTASEQPFARVLKDAEDFMYKRKLLEYKSLHSSIIASIKSTMLEKSCETKEHAERLAGLSKKIGQMMGLTEESLMALELLSTLHDIGKISIDRNILTKTGKLTDDEWAEIKKHPEVGYRITQASPDLRHVSELILCHHERWDGKGYPQGLAAENIPILSRILAIVDSYDAMTQDRSYRKAISKEEALQEIRRNAGSQFDPEIAGLFIKCVSGGPGSTAFRPEN